MLGRVNMLQREIVLLVIGTTLTLGSVAATAQTGTKDEINQTDISIADLYEQKGKLKEALAIWRKLLTADGDNKKYLAKVAELATSLDLFDEARTSAEKLVATEPNNERFRGYLASALVAQKKWPLALPQLEWLAKHQPNNVPIRRDLAGAYQELKRPTEALVILEWLVLREPASVEHRLSRVHAYSELKKTRKHRAALKALYARASKHPGVALEYGLFLIDEERFDDANAIARSMIQASPKDPRGKQLRDRVIKQRQIFLVRQTEERIRAERIEDWQADMQRRSEDF